MWRPKLFNIAGPMSLGQEIVFKKSASELDCMRFSVCPCPCDCVVCCGELVFDVDM